MPTPACDVTHTITSDVDSSRTARELAGFWCFEAFCIRDIRHGDVVDDSLYTIDGTHDAFGFGLFVRPSNSARQGHRAAIDMDAHVLWNPGIIIQYLPGCREDVRVKRRCVLVMARAPA